MISCFENGLAFEGSMCDGRGNKSVLGHPEGSFLSLERNGKRTFLSHTHAHKFAHTCTLLDISRELGKMAKFIVANKKFVGG